MILLRLDVDLPAAIPLANTGFGLMGIGGLLGFAAQPDYDSVGERDTVARQLKWNPKDAGSFKAARAQSSFGLSAAVGTLPDLGFTFSAKAGVLITAPDIAVRGSLNGRVLQPAVRMTDASWPAPKGISFLGFVAVDSAALSFGVLGQVDLQPLLLVRVPLAGHFPFTGDTSDWYTYLGADGAPVQGRGIGPISATVLPGILDVGADAYLMVRGSGIADWPYGRRLLSIGDGFVVAFGFSLQNTFGVKPVVWAELYASLDLLLASKPPTIAGFGQAGGSLNLGPFSLGVQAQVKFIVAAAQTYFWAEVTGRIELFFFDVEGTVTISFGDNEPALDLPQPDRHPLDRVDRNGAVVGSLGVLSDDSYRVVAQLVEDPAHAETVWPDTFVSLPFGVCPDINLAAAGAQFPGVLGPALPASKRLGTEMLHYTWRLETISLRDVTDEANKHTGAGKPPAGQLAARWQIPRSGAGGTDVSELLLFSTSPDLWVNRLVDGGAGLPGGDPLQQEADLCMVIVPPPDPGWAIGFLAGEEADGYRLPAELVSADPRVSRVVVHLEHNGLFYDSRGVVHQVPLTRARTLPEGYALDRAQLVSWPDKGWVEHEFVGHLTAPNLKWLADVDVSAARQYGSFVAQSIDLTLEEPVSAGVLVLVAPARLADSNDLLRGVLVHDDTQARWAGLHPEPIPTGDEALVFRAPQGAGPVGQLTVSFPLGLALGVVGFGGVTVTAADAVGREGTLVTLELQRRAAAAAAGPPTTSGANTPHQRTILDPGRLYRLDVDMTWSGEIAKQDEKGQIKVIDAKTVHFGDPASHTYTGGQTTKRSFFFRTAPTVDTPPPADGKRDPKTPATALHMSSLLAFLMTKQDVFRPEMLQRYLGGYDPAQSEQFRFCDDPLRAHFTQDHVAALAHAYGFDLKVAQRRVDKAGHEYDAPVLLSPQWSFALTPAFLAPPDRIRWNYATASQCKTPPPGSTASAADPGLEPEAWYEVYVQAKATEPSFADGRLPGVTFRTSRWRDPSEMFAALGFATAGHAAAPVLSGDLEIGAAAFPPALDDDQAFQNALTAMGLPGWPVAEQPRLSRLWVAGAAGGWLFAGLLVESLEPIDRPGRVDVGELTLKMGLAGGPVQFDLSRRDRARARLLFLARSPFTVVTRERFGRPGLGLRGRPLGIPAEGLGGLEGEPGGGFGNVRFRLVDATLTLHAVSHLDGATTPIDATLPLPPAPSFAGEP
jgi:hypothetical protein